MAAQLATWMTELALGLSGLSSAGLSE